MRLPGAGPANGGSGSMSSGGGRVASSSSGSKEMSPVACDDEVGRPNWIASGMKAANLPPATTPPASPSEAGLGNLYTVIVLNFALVVFDSRFRSASRHI